ncbi:HAD family hydrolase [Jeotgalibacillus salarius]|uniref:HAD-IIIA family hydrolase n=1 Tax=Jeotgalibacillus salarius TaxID=546023 RepID=A0A4Y8LNH7_9BACL|nr:HAD-IA family hydrolase [Jeotgalibacillus salarius]TFE02313.1 HAD-IIIA family hydrolase [Jeotgalibacillus salarius]
MIKAILFDLDGTLLDRDASLKQFLEDQYERFSEAFHHISKDTYMKRFIELDAKGYVWKDKVYSQLIKEFNIAGLNYEQLLQDYLDHFQHHCVGFSNLHQTLEGLQQNGLKLGIISNGRCQFQKNNIKGLRIEQFFNEILISGCENLKKPDPEIFKRALARMGVKAEETMFVGDHPLNDIKAARHTGMKTVWKEDLHWENAEASYVIEDLQELLIIAVDA